MTASQKLKGSLEGDNRTSSLWEKRRKDAREIFSIFNLPVKKFRVEPIPGLVKTAVSFWWRNRCREQLEIHFLKLFKPIARIKFQKRNEDVSKIQNPEYDLFMSRLIVVAL